MLKDLAYEALSVAGLVPATVSGTTQGSSQDFSNGEISTNMVVSSGAFGANTTSVQVACQESADGSTNWSTISGMVVTVSTSNSHQVVRGLRTSRYVRANVATVVGSTISVALAVDIIAQRKYSAASASLQGGYSRAPST